MSMVNCGNLRVSISAQKTSSMLDFVVMSSDLLSCVLDTWVERGVELSTDHHLEVSWILWRGKILTDWIDPNI